MATKREEPRFNTLFSSFDIYLKTLGLNGNNCNLSLKVTDNLKDEKDILDYYVSGDVAPLGRLGYEYGY